MKFLLTFCLCLFFYVSFANNIDNIITGNASPQSGSTEIYTVNWDSWGSVYENYANVSWNVTGGTLISSDKHTATIQWDYVPSWQNGYFSIDVYEDLGGQSGNMSVNIINFVEQTVETCDGVLGPPALAIDFGSGDNPGPPLPAGTTTYIYKPYCGINSGEYSLTNTSFGCHGDWLGIAQDHTPGDINGYMLIIDANDQRGEVYRSTVTGLTNAFKYEFSAWVANLDDDQVYDPPRVHFEVRDNSDNLLNSSGSFTIAYDPTDPWKRVSFMFDLPPGVTSVQVVLVNEHGGASGNDFVVDDISFAPCYPPIIASFSPNPTELDKSYTCNNGTVTLYSWWPTLSPPYNNPGFKWQKSTDNGSTWSDIPGATSISYTVTENTENRYYYRMLAYNVSNPSQFVISNTIIFFVQKMTVDAKTFYVNGCDASPVELDPTYSLQFSDPNGPALSYTYNWSPGTYLSNTQIVNPIVTLPALPPLNPPNPPSPPPPVNYLYTLTIQNTNYGCSGFNTQTVSHFMPRKVYIFNAFTPNNDGVNDYFVPVNIQDYTNFGAEFWIYDRWGGVIFHQTQGAAPIDWSWDGKVGGVPQATGVYVWRLKIPGCPLNYEGTASPDNPPVTIHGQVTLIR